MLLIYFFLLFIIISLENVYLVWLFMEMSFLFFFLFLINNESKSVGLIIYYFFQSFVSLMLFFVIYCSFNKFIFLFLCAKLGLFPFFYWVLVVSIKVGYLANMFVLGFQKVSVFWLLWLLMDVSLNLMYFLMYISIFFVIINLLMVSDLWLLLVYSSIANTGMLMVSVYGMNFLFAVFLYLVVIVSIINFLKVSTSSNELLMVVFFFLVVPPFVLFFMKFYVVVSLDFYFKLGFFLSFLDVFVLLYYFSLVFMKFMLMESLSLVYFLNLILLFFFLFFSNYVTMIVFN